MCWSSGFCDFFMQMTKKTHLRLRELPYDIIPASRSDDNRRAAGAVDLSAFRFYYEQTKSSGDCRPGGEAFSVICVFSGALNQ